VVREFLLPALDYSNGRYSEASVVFDLAIGDQSLFAICDDGGKPIAAATFRVLEFPSKRLLNVEMCGGSDLDAWVGDLVETAKAYAEEYQCDGIQMIGRNGWGPILEKFGVTSEMRLFELDL